MKENKRINRIIFCPYVWLIFACMLVHSLFNISASLFLFIVFTIIFIAFILKYINKPIYIMPSAIALLLLYEFFKSNKPILYLFILEFAIFAYILLALKMSNKLNTQNIAILIFVASFLLHATYILYTPYDFRQHDSGPLYLSDGHIGYIQYLLKNGFKMMDVDPTTVWQFYHPPVHHYIAAFWVKLNLLLGIEYTAAIENIQILTLFYSGCINILCYRIFKQLNFRGKSILIPFSIICFHPTFTLLSGSINNDILSIVFMLVSILYTIKWYKSGKTIHILILAFSIGLGMTTKLSALLITPAIAFIFIYKLFSDKSKKRLITQYFIFALICIPLGTWHSLYNYFVYGMEFGYVHELGEYNYLYIGNYSVFERLIGFKPEHLNNLNVIFEGDYKDYNTTLYILKSSVFGEWSFTRDSVTYLLSIFLFLSNIFLILCSFVCGVIYFIKNKIDNILKAFFAIIYIVILFSYIMFCFKYPYICSQDFRYIVPTVVIGAITIGYVIKQKNNRIMINLTFISTAIFSASSILLYYLYGF